MENSYPEASFISSYDSLGNKKWTKLYPSYSQSGGTSVTISSNNSIIYGGQINSGSGDVFVSSVDSEGDQQWSINLSGSGTEYLTGLTTDNNNNIYLSGYTYFYMDVYGFEKYKKY